LRTLAQHSMNLRACTGQKRGRYKGGRWTLANKFWRQTIVGEWPDCWTWLGAHTPAGYGMLTTWNGPRRGIIYAHRLSYEFMFGPLWNGAVVRHTCDNPNCVNPAHLIAGTQQENVDDMMRKGRWKPPRHDT